MPSDVSGHSAVVMGASTGMGFAAAARLAEAGATVTITWQSRDKLDAAVAKLPPGKATAHAADARKMVSVRLLELGPPENELTPFFP
jgi:NAD(P)-dependent dehydrogenase (short-subunit alcohol dehydrogenase family)